MNIYLYILYNQYNIQSLYLEYFSKLNYLNTK